MAKPKLLIYDPHIGFLLSKENKQTGGAAVQTLSWVAGVEKFFDLIIITDTYTHNEQISYPVYAYGNSTKSSNKQKIGFSKLILFFIQVIKKERPDVVYVSVPDINTFIWGILSYLYNLFYIQRISNDIAYDTAHWKRVGMSKKRAVKNFISEIGIRFANLALCQNEYQQTNLLKYLSKKKVKIVYNPFKGNGNEYSIPPSQRKYVAWIGLFQYQKNMEELYQIAKNVPEINFCVAGQPIENIDPETMQAIDKLKSLKNVIFKGLISREHIFDFLAQAFCLLNTSKYEGFSNTYLEAFYSGTPVITRKKTDPDGVIAKYNLGLVGDDYADLPILINDIKNSKENYAGNVKAYLKRMHDPHVIAEALYHEYKSARNL